MAEDQAAGAAQEEQVQQQFTMQRIYAKDVSFESPASPDIFRQNWQPNVNVDLNTRSSKADDTGNHEVVLTITVTAKMEDKNAFLVEVQQIQLSVTAPLEATHTLLDKLAMISMETCLLETLTNLVSFSKRRKLLQKIRLRKA